MKTANTTPDLDPTAFDPDGIAKAWIDILPSLPPEPGQHLIQRSGERGIVVDVSRYNSATGPEVGLIKVWSPTEGESEFWGMSYVKLDLSHPAGFGWAIRTLRGMDGWAAALGFEEQIRGFVSETGLRVDLGSLLGRWVTGQTTDADRVALACAIAAAS